jgi:hypothetical protein
VVPPPPVNAAFADCMGIGRKCASVLCRKAYVIQEDIITY